MNGADDKRQPAMVIQMPDGSRRTVTFEDLTISNNISLEAIVRILIKKNIITENDFVEELEKIKQERSPKDANIIKGK